MIPDPDNYFKKSQKRLLKMGRELIGPLRKAGFPVLDYLLSSKGKTYDERKAWILETIANLKPGVTQIILHPAVESDEIRNITHSHRARNDDYKVLLDPDVRKKLKEAGVILIGWKRINALFQEAVIKPAPSKKRDR